MAENVKTYLFPVADNCISDEEIAFDWDKLNTRFLFPRTGWMRITGEFLRFSLPETRIKIDQHISLQGWKVSTKFHALLREYGILYKVDLVWDNETVPLRVISLANNYIVEEFPFAVDTGDGPGFLISAKHFEVFRDHGKEKVAPGMIGVDRRLLFLCIISRTQYPSITLDEFSRWTPFMVKAQINWWATKEEMCGLLRVSGVEAGLEDYMGMEDQSVVEIKRVSTEEGAMTSVGRQDTSVLSWEPAIQPEPVKRCGKVETLAEEVGVSPALVSPEPVRHDMDAVKKNTRKRRRSGLSRKKRDAKRRRNVAARLAAARSPVSLSQSHERHVMRHILEAMDPDVPEDWVIYNQQVAQGERERDLDMEERYIGPGEIKLSPEDRREIIALQNKEIAKRRKALRAELMRRRESDISSENVSTGGISPRGELTGVSSSNGSPFLTPMPDLESSGGARRWSKDSSLGTCGLSVAGSPFLASPMGDERVISLVSSSTSSGSGRGPMSPGPIIDLRALLSDKVEIYCDDMSLECKLNEVFIGGANNLTGEKEKGSKDEDKDSEAKKGNEEDA